MNPLSSLRYTNLVDNINRSWGLIMRYLALRIELMERELMKESEND